MANLIRRSEAPSPWPAMDPDQRARFEERARVVVASRWPALRRAQAQILPELAADLEDLEEAPSLPAAQAMLAQLDALRRGAVGAPGEARPADVRWLLHRPARSLQTGEAEVASRGFFDVNDRPPPILWLEAIGRPRPGRPGQTDVAILCAIPSSALATAEAGRRACLNGALTFLDELSDPLSRQLIEGR